MRRITRSIVIGATLLVLGLGAVACGASTPQAAPPAAADQAAGQPVPEVVITAREYSFSGPESIPGGWTQFTLDNQGAKAHDLILFKLDSGKTMDDVMAALESDAPPDWISIVGQSSAEAGKRTRFIANLAPGNYGMISFGDDESGPPDAAQGMVKGLTVTAAPGAQAALPVADAEIEMLDFGYAAAPLPGGTALIKITNTGAEDHEAVIFRINEGKTIDDVRALLGRPEEEQEQQYEQLLSYSGSLAAAAGQTVYVEQELAPGRYALICFLPSPANGGRAHYELGMVEELVVE